VVFSADYTLPNTLSMIAELYYNGQGKTDPASYQFARLFNGEIQSLAQRYLGAMVRYDLPRFGNGETITSATWMTGANFCMPVLYILQRKTWNGPEVPSCFRVVPAVNTGRLRILRCYKHNGFSRLNYQTEK
jgi:hypothetical protein